MRLSLISSILLATALVPAGAPAHAVPIGPPRAGILVSSTDDPYVYTVRAAGTDPDGAITHIELCATEHACAESDFPEPDDPVGRATVCLEGDRREISATVRFTEATVRRFTASVTAGGCPVVGRSETATTEFDFRFVPPEPVPPAPGPIECAETGTPEATDAGVFADRVVIGAPVTAGGPDANWLGGVGIAIRAAANRVNTTGGVCGRLLDVHVAPDDNDADRGAALIRAFGEDAFAVVSPSPNGLRKAIAEGLLEESGLPVVGSAATDDAELRSPLVWPIGSSADTFATIAVRDAYDRGARSVAVVYDEDWTYGVQGAAAMADVVAALPGASVKASIGVRRLQPSYSSEAQTFNAACEEGCDLVVLILDPPTAETWVAARPRPATMVDAGAPSLLSLRFAENCKCSDFVAWTGFRPPVATRCCAVGQYERDLKAVSPTIDTINPYTEGAYAATLALAQAMGRAGVHLTRIGLGDVLGADALDQGLTSAPVSWASNRDANRAMRAYSSVVANDSFAGFRAETGWMTP